MSATPAKAKRAAKPKKPATHPKYSEMIAKAITALKERGGSSRQAILKHIMANFNVGKDANAVNARLKLALKKGVAKGTLKQSKGKGASGSFRVGEKKAAAPKKRAAKPKKAKKPRAKKAKAAAEGGDAAAGGAPAAAKPKKARSPKKKSAKPKKPKTPKKAKAAKPKKAKTPKKAKAAKPKAKKSPKKAKKAAKK